MTRYGADLHTWGGLFGTTRATRQREALAVIEYELLYTIARHDLAAHAARVPTLRARLAVHVRQARLPRPVDPGRSLAHAVPARVRPELIHEAPLSRRERWLTVAGTHVPPRRSPARRATAGCARRWFGGSRAHAPSARRDAHRSVTAYIANLNTARVTELCIRSMREFSGDEFALVVGDCGSTDGSLRMLERFASHGLARAPGRAERPDPRRLARPLAAAVPDAVRAVLGLRRRVPGRALAHRHGRHRAARPAPRSCAAVCSTAPRPSSTRSPRPSGGSRRGRRRGCS